MTPAADIVDLSERGTVIASAGLTDADLPMAVRGLTVTYGEKPAVFSVDATFEARKMTAIVGPNGAGKSTFLKASLGILPKVSGDVRIFGKPVKAARDRIAYVPQRASVDWDFPTTVMDVVMMGLYARVGLLKRFTTDLRAEAADCLDRVGMADFGHRQIGRLSGGQQQRVFLARALAQAADLYLLDEPFAGVDAATERAIIGVLKDLRADGKAVVAVHHDLATVPQYFDDVLMINVRRVAQGAVETTFTPEMLNKTYGGKLAATHVAQLNVGHG